MTRRASGLLTCVIAVVLGSGHALAGTPSVPPRSDLVFSGAAAPSRAMRHPVLGHTSTGGVALAGVQSDADRAGARHPVESAALTADAWVSVAAALNPLTGLPASEPALLERRPMAIKISNYPRDIRPQFGLNEADVVFEYYIEWGYTRFIGIFYGQDARQIGPVRSGRYFDEHVTRMYQAYYVFNYADPREYEFFLGGDLQPFVVVPGYVRCPPFFEDRVSSFIVDVRHYETYFDSTRFGACLEDNERDNTRPDLQRTLFGEQWPAGGTEVERIFTYYSRCDYNYWQYDPEGKRYLRYQERSPSDRPRELNECSDRPPRYVALMDSVNTDQVHAENVVVIYASHTFANAGEQDDEIYHINLMDSGRAYVFRDGLAWPARWVRTDIDQPLVLTTVTGQPLALRPGRTFFQILGETSAAWSEDKDWEFEFRTP